MMSTIGQRRERQALAPGGLGAGEGPFQHVAAGVVEAHDGHEAGRVGWRRRRRRGRLRWRRRRRLLGRESRELPRPLGLAGRGRLLGRCRRRRVGERRLDGARERLVALRRGRQRARERLVGVDLALRLRRRRWLRRGRRRDRRCGRWTRRWGRR